MREMEFKPLTGITNAETFTWEFFKPIFNGEQWRPGFYFVGQHKPNTLPSRSYWILDA